MEKGYRPFFSIAPRRRSFKRREDPPSDFPRRKTRRVALSYPRFIGEMILNAGKAFTATAEGSGKGKRKCLKGQIVLERPNSEQIY